MAETKKTLVERLFVEHAGPLRAFLYRRVHRHPDAAELAQEVYVRMLRVPDMGTIRNPEAYLYTVASNLAKEHARHEHKDASALEIDDPLLVQLEDGEEPHHHLEALDERSRELPERDAPDARQLDQG